MVSPHNDPNLPTTDPNNPNCLTVANGADEVHVPAGVKLVIDGSQLVSDELRLCKAAK